MLKGLEGRRKKNGLWASPTRAKPFESYVQDIPCAGASGACKRRLSGVTDTNTTTTTPTSTTTATTSISSAKAAALSKKDKKG